MFGSKNKQIITVSISEDPAADQDYPLFRAPESCEVVAAHAIVVDDVAASTANYFDLALLNGGAAGTATTALAGTIGGTAGWTGLTPKTFTISEGTLAAGDVVVAQYNEAGTGTFKQLTVQLEVIYGIGA